MKVAIAICISLNELVYYTISRYIIAWQEIHPVNIKPHAFTCDLRETTFQAFKWLSD